MQETKVLREIQNSYVDSTSISRRHSRRELSKVMNIKEYKTRHIRAFFLGTTSIGIILYKELLSNDSLPI